MQFHFIMFMWRVGNGIHSQPLRLLEMCFLEGHWEVWVVGMMASRGHYVLWMDGYLIMGAASLSHCTLVFLCV